MQPATFLYLGFALVIIVQLLLPSTRDVALSAIVVFRHFLRCHKSNFHFKRFSLGPLQKKVHIMTWC